MDFLKDVLRGVLIGVANVIPGVSGGTIALSMGVYEKIISAINNLKKDIKGSIKTLLPYIIGIIIGVVGLAFIIEFLLDKFPFPTIFAFIGLIIGGVPQIYQRVKGEKIKFTHVISFILLALVIIIPTILGNSSLVSDRIIEFSFVSVIIMLLLGVLAATSMVVPGVSGSMMLMILGFYNSILSMVSSFVKSMIAIDVAGAFQAAKFLIPFGIGVIAGIFIAAKIIQKLLERYPLATMWGILALVIASPFAILYGVSFEGITVMTVIVSFVTFILGFLIAMRMSDKH